MTSEINSCLDELMIETIVRIESGQVIEAGTACCFGFRRARTGPGGRGFLDSLTVWGGYVDSWNSPLLSSVLAENCYRLGNVTPSPN